LANALLPEKKFIIPKKVIDYTVKVDYMVDKNMEEFEGEPIG